MPTRILPYLKGLLQGYKVTTTFLAYQFGFSHDALTRTLNSELPWRKIILWVIQRLFGVLSGGYLVIDDTVLAKPFGKKFVQANFAYSSSLDKVVYGYHVVVMSWTNGNLTLPLSWRFYQSKKKSKIKLASELLEEAKIIWQLLPKVVLFDSFYSANTLLNQIEGYGWKFTCQIKKNRIISCAPIEEDLIKDGDQVTGLVTDQVKGTIIRHDGKFFLTNVLILTQAETLSLYAYRWSIEEIFRFLKSELHLEKCQARSNTAQETHLASCILAYLLIQRERQEKSPKLTTYAVKREWLVNRRYGNNRINHYVKVLSA